MADALHRLAHAAKATAVPGGSVEDVICLPRDPLRLCKACPSCRNDSPLERRGRYGAFLGYAIPELQGQSETDENRLGPLAGVARNPAQMG